MGDTPAAWPACMSVTVSPMKALLSGRGSKSSHGSKQSTRIRFHEAYVVGIAALDVGDQTVKMIPFIWTLSGPTGRFAAAGNASVVRVPGVSR
jgi:hypothetical protein